MFYKFARFIVSVIFGILYRFEVSGIENLPETGGFIICSSHSMLKDPIVIAKYVKRQLRFMAKKELFSIWGLKQLITALGAYPVDRKSADTSTYKNTIKLLNNGEVLLIFAQGTRMSEVDVKSAKAGVALFAVKTQVPVIPCGIKHGGGIFSKITLRFDEPMTFEKYKDEKLKTEVLSHITEEIMTRVKACTL